MMIIAGRPVVGGRRPQLSAMTIAAAMAAGVGAAAVDDEKSARARRFR